MPKRSEPVVPSLLDAQQAPAPAVTAGAADDDDDAVAGFEQKLQELETIVAQMEKGDLRLEDSLRLFERGTQLARACRKSLNTAELKVRSLLDDADDDAGQP